VAAQVLAMLPQFWGISGSTSTIFSTAITSLPTNPLASPIVCQTFHKINPKITFFATFHQFNEKMLTHPAIL
jgi:hypothetical protein